MPGARGLARPGKTWTNRFNHPYTARKGLPGVTVPVVGCNQGTPWALFNSVVGPVSGFRGYNTAAQGVPASYPGPGPGIIPAQVPPSGQIISFKPDPLQVLAGTLDTALAAYFATVPAGAFMTAWHEGEIFAGVTTSQLIAMHTRLYQIFSVSAPAGASYGQIVAAASSVSGNAGFPLGPWMCTPANGGAGLDFYGIDTGSSSNTATFEDSLFLAMNTMIAAGVPAAGPWTIPEAGVSSTWRGPQAQWFSDGWNVANAIGAIHYMPFFGIPGGPGQVFWPPPSREAVRVLQDIAAISRGDPRSPAAATPARSTTAPIVSSTSTTTLTATFSVSPPAGAKVLVYIQCGFAITFTVTDNGATPATFTYDGSCLSASGAPSVFVFRADNITLPGAGSYAVTVVRSGTGPMQVGACAYTGVQNGPPIATSAVVAAGSNPALFPVTPVDQASLLFAAFFCDSALNPESITPATPEFILGATQLNGTSLSPGAVSDAIILDPRSRAGGWTLADAPDWAAVMAAYSALPAQIRIVPGAQAVYAQAIDPDAQIAVNAGAAAAAASAPQPTIGVKPNAALAAAAVTAPAPAFAAPPAVTLVGAVGVAGPVAAGSITGNYGQSPTAGHALLAVVTWSGTTLETFAPTASAGWTRLTPSATGNNPAGTSHCGVDFWVKTAAGGDAQPVFTQTSAGTFVMGCAILELAGASGTPLDTSGVYQSGSTTIAFPTMTPTTAGSVAAAGSFAVAAFAQDNNAAVTETWTELGTGWTSAYSDGATSQVGHSRINYQAAVTSGAPFSDSGHFSVGSAVYAAAAVVVIAPAGAGATTWPAAATASSASAASGTLLLAPMVLAGTASSAPRPATPPFGINKLAYTDVITAMGVSSVAAWRSNSSQADGVPVSWPGPAGPVPSGVTVPAVGLKPGGAGTTSAAMSAVTAGTFDTALAAFFALVPPGALITSWHEAETDGETPAVCIAFHAHMYALFKANAPASALYGQTFTCFTANPSSSFYPLSQWVCGAGNAGGTDLDFYGLDGYQPSTSSNTPAQVFGPALAQLRTVTARPVAILETNVDTPNTGWDTWFADAWAWGLANGALAFIVFWGSGNYATDHDSGTPAALNAINAASGQPAAGGQAASGALLPAAAAGAASSVSSAAGNLLLAPGVLAATAASPSAASGAFTGVTLAGTASSASAASGTVIFTAEQLAAAAPDVSTATGAITLAPAVAAATSATAALAAGTLAALIPLAGSAATLTAASGATTVRLGPAGTSATPTAAAATVIFTTEVVAATAPSLTGAAGTLGTPGLTATAGSVSAAAAAVTLAAVLAATAPDGSLAAGQITSAALAATATASQLSAALGAFTITGRITAQAASLSLGQGTFAPATFLLAATAVSLTLALADVAVPPHFAQLTGVTARPPHGRWSARWPRARYSAGSPHS